jgi:hypothetical protein
MSLLLSANECLSCWPSRDSSDPIRRERPPPSRWVHGSAHLPRNTVASLLVTKPVPNLRSGDSSLQRTESRHAPPFRHDACARMVSRLCQTARPSTVIREGAPRMPIHRGRLTTRIRRGGPRHRQSGSATVCRHWAIHGKRSTFYHSTTFCQILNNGVRIRCEMRATYRPASTRAATGRASTH